MSDDQGIPNRPDHVILPPTPGARRSPQIPGQVPDRSTVPGHHATRVPPRQTVRRPLTEYGTAQRIMGVYSATPDAENDPARFEQATVSFEELRKADPRDRTPDRPMPGYVLQTGEQATEIPKLPENVSNEPTTG